MVHSFCSLYHVINLDEKSVEKCVLLHCNTVHSLLIDFMINETNDSVQKAFVNRVLCKIKGSAAKVLSISTQIDRDHGPTKAYHTFRLDGESQCAPIEECF